MNKRDAIVVADAKMLEAKCVSVSWSESVEVPPYRGTGREHLLSEDVAFLLRRSEGWRPISPKRARKLRRRGEDVRYLPEFGSSAWIPLHLRDEEH